jgi:hypothetical protein
MIRVSCPGCNREFDFADFLAGLTTVCKHCGQGIPIPSAQRPTSSSVNTKPASEVALKASSGATEASRPGARASAGEAIQSANDPVQESPGPNRDLTDSQQKLSVDLKIPDIRSDSMSATGARPAPEWAFERTKAMLQLGYSAPEMVQQLTAQGLHPEIATAVLDQLLEEQVKQQVEPLRRIERGRPIHRTVSAVVAVSCVGLSFYYFGGPYAAWTSIRVLVPTALIWFPEELNGLWSRASPLVIRWVGWLVLVLIFGRVMMLVATVTPN